MKEYEDRKKLTFEQAEGAAPLPTQLQIKEISQELRALLWFAVHESIAHDVRSSDFVVSKPIIQGRWKSILFDRHVFLKFGMADEFSASAQKHITDVKDIFQTGDYLKIFGFLQFVLRHRQCPYQLSPNIKSALIRARAAYRIVDDSTIVPVASDQDQATLDRAFRDLSKTEFHGARNHLRTAASELTAGKFTDSVRESIHSVESVARSLTTSGNFREALIALERKAQIHTALKQGFNAIYGYTSDEKGIRHPLLDDATANVDESDALFMIGACASFVSYMINKGQTAGLLGSTE